MKGIQAQPDWSPTAAGAALGGIGFTFLVWWMYFEYARAASDRPVRTGGDRRAYEVWTYARVPLYLGMVLSAVGVEHLIKQGTSIHLKIEEAWLLGGALGVVLARASGAARGSDRARGCHSRARVRSSRRSGADT